MMFKTFVKEVIFEFLIRMQFLDGDNYFERALGLLFAILMLPATPLVLLCDLFLLPLELLVGLIMLVLFIIDKIKEKNNRLEN